MSDLIKNIRIVNIICCIFFSLNYLFPFKYFFTYFIYDDEIQSCKLLLQKQINIILLII